MNEETGKRIGDYEILGALGSGGMGQVFKARNVISDRVEALKVLLPDLSGQQDLVDRFLREIKIVAALNHPNIAALRTAFATGNQLVMVMEYVEGASLATHLEQGGISIKGALNYIDQVLNALSYAHGRSVVHRDIKPANMVLTPAGVIKLMDFGIARSGMDSSLTATGTTMGSLYYMSPEQVKGTSCDARSDLYSVGVSLYEMVTGEPPFRAHSDYSLMAAQVQQLPKPPMELRPDIPSALNEIILTALAKEPEDRFQSADAFRDAVNAVRQGLHVLHPAHVAEATPNGLISATALLQRADSAALVTEVSSTSVEPPPAVPPQMQTPAASLPAARGVSTKPIQHRGLYMGLGALLVLAMLLLVALYVPRRIETHASTQAGTKQPQNSDAASPHQNEQTQPGDTQQASPTTNDSAAGSPSSDATSGSAYLSTLKQHADSVASLPNVAASNSNGQIRHKTAIASVEKSSATASTRVTSRNGGYGSSRPYESQPAETQPADLQQTETRSTDHWEQLEREADQLSSRASSINESLDNLHRQQSAQGLALRGDISAAQAMMNANIAKAKSALQDPDADKARRYMDLAQAEIEKLEEFLGH